jgi:hypothetical protein
MHRSRPGCARPRNGQSLGRTVRRADADRGANRQLTRSRLGLKAVVGNPAFRIPGLIIPSEGKERQHQGLASPSRQYDDDIGEPVPRPPPRLPPETTEPALVFWQLPLFSAPDAHRDPDQSPVAPTLSPVWVGEQRVDRGEGPHRRGRHREENAMPQAAWTNKRERQYDHIKDGLRERGGRRRSRRRSRRGPSTRNEPGAARPRVRAGSRRTTSHRAGAAGCARIVAAEDGPATSFTRKPDDATSGADPKRRRPSCSTPSIADRHPRPSTAGMTSPPAEHRLAVTCPLASVIRISPPRPTT